MILALSPFQSIALVGIVLMVIGSVLALVRGWAGRRESLVWLAIWLAAGVTILWPGITSRLANSVGIGRGADLVFYCTILVLLIGIWLLYLRLRGVRREITLLVRHIALLEAERAQTPPRSDDSTAD